MSVYAELKRRNVFRVAAGYLVLAWLLLQVGDVLFETLELPGSWIKGLLALLLLGFIPALVFSWVYELTPEGLKKESDVEPGDSIAGHTARKLDLAVIALGVVALILFGLDRFQSPPDVVPDSPARPAETAVATPSDDSTPIIAVLPFKATGSDDGGELASGLHDDLLTRLAKMGAFKVISRTSMMEYAETTKNMRQIGLELGAGYILEGGVQARGSRIRINAQLIDAPADEHLWAEIYDRELTASDLFDIQADLSKAIAQAMKITLSPNDRALVETAPTENMAAYRAYLRGLNRSKTRGWVGGRDLPIVEDFREAVELDPEFALAWASLADALIGYSLAEPKAAEEALVAIAKARALEPGLLEAELAWAHYLYRVLKEYQQALEALELLGDRAMRDFDAINLKSFLLRRLGRFQEAYDAGQAALQLDPRDAMQNVRVSIYAVHLDDCETAMSLANNALSLDPDVPDVQAATAGIFLNCAGDAERVHRLLLDADFPQDPGFDFALHASDHLRNFERTSALIDTIPDQAGTLGEVYKLSLRVDLLRGQGQDTEAGTLVEAAGEVLGALADADQASDSGYAWGSAWYQSRRRDAEATLGWLDEVRRRTSVELKGDELIESQNRLWIAGMMVAAGLHDQAIEELEVMLKEPGGFRFPYFDGMTIVEPLQGHPGYESLRERFDQRVAF